MTKVISRVRKRALAATLDGREPNHILCSMWTEGGQVLRLITHISEAPILAISPSIGGGIFAGGMRAACLPCDLCMLGKPRERTAVMYIIKHKIGV